MPGHLIRRLQQISVSVFADRMRNLGHDLTAPQFAALTTLARAPGIDQATLAGMIAHDRPTIGGVVERLEGKGLLARTQSKTDRRAKVLVLTAEGEALLETLTPEIRALQSEILPGLSAEEQATFVALAEKVAKAGNDVARAPLILPTTEPQDAS